MKGADPPASALGRRIRAQRLVSEPRAPHPGDPCRRADRAGTIRAADDEVRSIRKAKDRDSKEFITQVGTAIVKAARTSKLGKLKNIELDEYKYVTRDGDKKTEL